MVSRQYSWHEVLLCFEKNLFIALEWKYVGWFSAEFYKWNLFCDPIWNEWIELISGWFEEFLLYGSFAVDVERCDKLEVTVENSKWYWAYFNAFYSTMNNVSLCHKEHTHRSLCDWKLCGCMVTTTLRKWTEFQAYPFIQSTSHFIEITLVCVHQNQKYLRFYRIQTRWKWNNSLNYNKKHEGYPYDLCTSYMSCFPETLHL